MLDIILSSLTALCALGLGIFAQRKMGTVRKDQRPHQVPWGLIMIGCVFVLFMVFVHLLNVLGVETGPENSFLGRI